MSDINIGKTVKQIRQQKGLSAKELAAKADITPSMLTQIEKGQSNPSINTIKQVSQALDTPLYIFFLAEDSTNALVVKKDDHCKLSYEIMPNTQYEILTPPGADMDFCRMTVAPHHVSSDKMFSHSTDEMAVVIKGCATVVMDDAEYLVEEGDSVRIPATCNHRWENRTDDSVEVIYVIGHTGNKSNF